MGTYTITLDERTLEGKSLKRYLQNLGILSDAKTKGKHKATDNNPSPSNDPWFDVPENRESVERGLAQAEAGQYKIYNSNELEELLSL